MAPKPPPPPPKKPGAPPAKGAPAKGAPAKDAASKGAPAKDAKGGKDAKTGKDAKPDKNTKPAKDAEKKKSGAKGEESGEGEAEVRVLVPPFPVRHWRGDLSLGLAFWINGVLFTLAIAATGGVGLYALGSSKTPSSVITMVAIFVVVTALLSTWQLVGLWRVAEKALKNGSGSAMCNGVRIWVIFVLVLLLGGLLESVAITAVYGRIAMGADGYGSFVLGRRGENTLALDGYFSFETPDAIEAVLRGDDKLNSLQLNSPGGYAGPARETRITVEQRKLTTFIERECSGTCVIPFLASETRVIGRRGRVGFYLYRPEGLEHALPRGSHIADVEERDIEPMRKLGVDGKFLTRVLSPANRRTVYPSMQELTDAKVITHVYDGVRLVPAAQYCNRNSCD